MWSDSIARSAFSDHASVFRIDKNLFIPVLFAQSVTFSELSFLIGWSTLHYFVTDDVGKTD